MNLVNKYVVTPYGTGVVTWQSTSRGRTNVEVLLDGYDKHDQEHVMFDASTIYVLDD